MSAEPNRKIIAFPGLVGAALPAVCAVCGAPRSPGHVCRHCARHLVDLAFSSLEEGGNLPETWELPGQEPDAVAPLPALRYDHYEICRTMAGAPWELGRGAMGITYKATDTNLGSPVALKVINTCHLPGADGRERFLREARTAARLHHPNIATVFHLGQGDENCFYVMEFIAGETLEERVRRTGPPPVETALDIVTQVARALRAAHQQRFIHRDIKPTNLMLVEGEPAQAGGGELVVKVIDFGLAKALTDEDGAGWNRLCQGYFVGTPFYASPEQLAGGTADARSDLYSLGRCLWYMLAGSPPRPLSEPPAPQGPPPRHVAVPLPTTLPPGVPAAMRALVSSMTAEDPARRPQSAAELLQQIQGCRAALRLEREPTAFLKTGNTRRWLGLAGVLLLAGVAALIGKTHQGSGKEPPTTGRSTSTVDARMLYGQGDEHLRRLNPTDNRAAAECYTKAIACSPGFADAYAALAGAQYQGVARFGAPRRELDLASINAQRAIAIDPQAPRGYTVLGSILTYQGRHWDALTELHRALELNPRYLPAMRNFTLLWCLVGQSQLGLPWAAQATRLQPTDSSAWTSLADACLDLGDDAQAEECYRRCLEINPGWMPAHCGRMHIDLLHGDYPQVEAHYAVTRSIEEGSACALSLLAEAQLFGGDYARAETTYRALVAKDRTGAVTYYGGISYLSALGFLRCRAGDPAEGDPLLAEAARLHINDSDGPQAAYDLAAIRSIQGHREDALSLLQQAIASGWMEYRLTRQDPRFESLREEPRFQELLDGLSVHVTAMRAEAQRLCAKPLAVADYPVQPPQGLSSVARAGSVPFTDKPERFTPGARGR